MSSFKISVERLLEQEVDEINRSGEEKYVKPFTLSEELTYLAGKIDFHEGIHNLSSDIPTSGENDVKDDNMNEKEVADANQVNQWPWEAVHSKLRIALSEMCVMLDVLQNLNRKKYLVLDPIQQSPELNKQTVQMLEKRKFLARAGAIIAKGAACLSKKKDESEPIVVEENEEEYYMQLMQLRQYWRVKKTGNQIIGDVSYRSAGSKFWHPGLFEVKVDHSNLNDNKKTLIVNISPDIMQKSEIIVQINDWNAEYPWECTSTFSAQVDDDTPQWQKDLKLAQQHLFNKELFAHLSNDAFQGSFMGVEVLKSKITCKIEEDAELIISHQTGECVNVKQEVGQESATDLKILLGSLLQKYHKLNSKWHTPYPSTSSYYQKQTKSSTIHNLLHRQTSSKGNSILKDFLEEAKHKVWVNRMKYYLRKKSKQLCDPTLLVHWNMVKSRLQTALHISVISITESGKIITSFSISVDPNGFHMTFEDATTIDLPFDITALNTVVCSKIRSHLLDVVNHLCQQCGWTVSQSSWKYSTVTDTKQEFPENGIICVSKAHSKCVKLLLNDVGNIFAEMTVLNSTDEITSLLDDKFKNMNKLYQQVFWDSIPGKTFVEKCQTLFLID